MGGSLGKGHLLSSCSPFSFAPVLLHFFEFLALSLGPKALHVLFLLPGTPSPLANSCFSSSFTTQLQCLSCKGPRFYLKLLSSYLRSNSWLPTAMDKQLHLTGPQLSPSLQWVLMTDWSECWGFVPALTVHPVQTLRPNDIYITNLASASSGDQLAGWLGGCYLAWSRWRACELRACRPPGLYF